MQVRSNILHSICTYEEKWLKVKNEHMKGNSIKNVCMRCGKKPKH